MIYTILESIRYTLTLLFGIFVSALFLDIRINKKNVICLFLFFYIDLVLQGIFYFTKDLSAVISLYPFITHLPLLLFFVLIFKKRLFPSLIAITSAYLCCQISNWTTIFVSSFIKNIDNITYSLTLIISFVFIIKFVYLPISQLLKKQSRELISFGIIPIFYYIFDIYTINALSFDLLRASLKNFAQLIAGCALDERQRRWFYGFLASEIGYGGSAAVARSLGVSPITVKAGLQEVAGSGERPDIKKLPKGRIRRAGGGRKRADQSQPGMRESLNILLESSTAGDPMRVILWTTLSLRKIAEHLEKQGVQGKPHASSVLVVRNGLQQASESKNDSARKASS